MKKLFTALKVRRLKKRAGKLYLAHHRAHAHLDCGHALGEHITGGRRQRLADQFNAAIDQLEAMGANPPKTRL